MAANKPATTNTSEVEYLDHLARIPSSQDTTAIAQVRQLANMGSTLGDLDNTSLQHANTAKADALALDRALRQIRRQHRVGDHAVLMRT